jgi:F-type H+-transporting ATPase subunit c
LILEKSEMMFRICKMCFVVMIAMVLISAPALAMGVDEAADELAHERAVALAKSSNWGRHLAAGIAAGLATIGGGFGIGRLAASALEGTARQPEAGGDIRTTMIIAAALIEGFTFFAIVVGLLLAG